MRFDHPIFQGPRVVDVTTETKRDPHTGDEIAAWRVQEDVGRPGLVASRRRFVAAPDSEILAGGVNSKGNRGVPLVREGNLFLWGFSAAPDRMTEAGRAALANAIVYMRDFDGQAPTRRAGVRARGEWRDILDSPYVEGVELPRYFGPSLIAAHGTDKEALRADLEVREPYLYVARGSATLRIDADAEALGHPTNSFDLIRAALEANDERGTRILERYWPNDELVAARPTTLAGLDALADEVCFSEGEGYRWLSRPSVAGPERWEIAGALASLQLPRTSEQAPAVFGARLVGSYQDASGKAHTAAGSVATLAVRAEVLRGWHVTLASDDGMYTPVTIELELPDGARWVADEFTVDGRARREKASRNGYGRLDFTREFWARCAPGEYELAGKIRFQVCDEERCLRPTQVEFTTTLVVYGTR
ncbi:MAG: hypothetical protein H6831_00425 [Planctomycetes bacterium]|nr:hypothetical protein [Planctomycetota bacterium]MCB9902851.1 hypothetical protein [Planctomycetota bacterium]